MLEADLGVARGAKNRLLELCPAGGEPDQAASPIAGVDLSTDVAAEFEVTQEIVHCLFRDLELVREICRTAAVEAGVAEERDVRPGDVREAGFPDRDADLVSDALPDEAQERADPWCGRITQRAISVSSGADRAGEDLRIWGMIPLQVKVSTADTAGALFLFEHANMGPGGPPRHLHHDQDEWFYVVDGAFEFEVGDDAFTLHAGDSLFAPRRIPHVWACVSERGTLLLGVQPAGSLEAFFRTTCAMDAPPSMEETARLFEQHGMQVVGPPLRRD